MYIRLRHTWQPEPTPLHYRYPSCRPRCLGWHPRLPGRLLSPAHVQSRCYDMCVGPDRATTMKGSLLAIWRNPAPTPTSTTLPPLLVLSSETPELVNLSYKPQIKHNSLLKHTVNVMPKLSPDIVFPSTMSLTTQRASFPPVHPNLHWS